MSLQSVKKINTINSGTEEIVNMRRTKHKKKKTKKKSQSNIISTFNLNTRKQKEITLQHAFLRES